MKKLMLLVLVVALAMTIVSTAFAAPMPPCNDFDGDGSPSGYEYAQYHIAAMAKAGILGQGHKPGVVHQGFSTCNPGG